MLVFGLWVSKAIFVNPVLEIQNSSQIETYTIQILLKKFLEILS